ncbi:hypothetical protein F5B21DRAFT_520096 [Xylaria acuta]|nr:hypothetical protein F5B21DRAFT_520096 [Xylaria acuta]
MHPPLIYCPRSTEFKFHIVEEQECHLYPHHTPAQHLGVDNTDAVFSASPNSGPSEEDAAGRYAENRTAPPSVPAERVQACHDTHSGEVGKEPLDQQNNHRVSVLDETAQHTRADHEPVTDRGIANSSLSNQRTTRSQIFNDSYERAANSKSRPGDSFETEGLITQYKPRRSSFNGYRTNRAYSGAPFDYRHHHHSDPQHQYYPYQQAATPPIQYSSQSNLPTHVYMEVEGPSRYYQRQGSTASASSHFDYSRIVPESNYGRNSGVHESNPLPYNTTPKSSFNPEAVAFDYWKTNPNTPSNLEAAILDSDAYNRYKSRKCRESLEQLQRSNKAAYYNCGYYVGSQGVAANGDQNTNTENGHASVGNPQPGSSSANGGYSATNTCHEPRSRSRSWSESYSRRASIGEVSSSIIQEENSLSYQDHDSNIKRKGKEVLRNPVMSWVNMSTPRSSVESVARVGFWYGSRDAGTQTDDYPVYCRGTDQQATSPQQQETATPPEADQGSYKANSHGDLASTDEVSNNDSTDLGIVSVKTESDGGDCQARDLAEFTPTKTKTDPGDEVKLHDISPASAVPVAPDPMRRSTKSPPLSEAAPTASASVSVAPEPPRKPQPRLWSQVLGGSANKVAGVTKSESDSSKDEVNWPSLGSGGPSKGRKRNTTP